MNNNFTCPNCDRSFHRGYKQAMEDLFMELKLIMLKRNIRHYIIINGDNDNIMRDIQFQKDSAFDLLAELIIMRKDKTNLDGYLKFTEKIQRFLEDYEYIKEGIEG